ncbi:hypothetical protein A33M_2974 [Rhodovulum sp. PH10]|uniref:hypothetical protein n=1 Tax=Rhodovulum sp. PH10 TaxID=1187851 RepID=UPI00027C2C43|nr:hypothetical protein [Rhodovulum sp. PH10]EJW11615.1 hypothetical protein A33M_2974 [Rhodovulum sp. PH10]
MNTTTNNINDTTKNATPTETRGLGLTEQLVEARCWALGEQYRRLPICDAESALLEKEDSFIIVLGYGFIAHKAKEQLDRIFNERRWTDEGSLDHVDLMTTLAKGYDLLLRGDEEWSDQVEETGTQPDADVDQFLAFLADVHATSSDGRTTIWAYAFSQGFDPQSAKHIADGISTLDVVADAIATEMGVVGEWKTVPEPLRDLVTSAQISSYPEVVYERVLLKRARSVAN